MNRTLSLSFLIYILLLQGCALLSELKKLPQPGFFTKEEIESIKVDTIFDGPIDEIWPTVTEALFDMGFEIEMASKESGIINISPMIIKTTEIYELAVEPYNDRYVTVNPYKVSSNPIMIIRCFIRPVEEKTSVKIKVGFEAYGPGEKRIECRSNGKIERIFFKKVEKLLKREE